MDMSFGFKSILGVLMYQTISINQLFQLKTDRGTIEMIGWFAYWLIVWLIDWLIDRLIIWLVGWSVGRLVDWLIEWLIFNCLCIIGSLCTKWLSLWNHYWTNTFCQAWSFNFRFVIYFLMCSALYIYSMITKKGKFPSDFSFSPEKLFFSQAFPTCL